MLCPTKSTSTHFSVNYFSICPYYTNPKVKDSQGKWKKFTWKDIRLMSEIDLFRMAHPNDFAADYIIPYVVQCLGFKLLTLALLLQYNHSGLIMLLLWKGRSATSIGFFHNIIWIKSTPTFISYCFLHPTYMSLKREHKDQLMSLFSTLSRVFVMSFVKP